MTTSPDDPLELPETITSVEEIQQLVRWCIATIGPGYHPDTPAEDYVDPENRAVFDPAMCVRLNELHRQVFCHPDGAAIYDIGLALQREALGFPDED